MMQLVGRAEVGAVREDWRARKGCKRPYCGCSLVVSLTPMWQQLGNAPPPSARFPAEQSQADYFTFDLNESIAHSQRRSVRHTQGTFVEGKDASLT